MRRLCIRPIIIALLAVALAGCGSASFRGGQDWSGVTDSRLWRTCHVTDYGSGVVIRHDARSMVVLTVAHLIEGETVDVHLPDRVTGGYVSRRALEFRGPHGRRSWAFASLYLRRNPVDVEVVVVVRGGFPVTQARGECRVESARDSTRRGFG